LIGKFCNGARDEKGKVTGAKGTNLWMVGRQPYAAIGSVLTLENFGKFGNGGQVGDIVQKFVNILSTYRSFGNGGQGEKVRLWSWFFLKRRNSSGRTIQKWDQNHLRIVKVQIRDQEAKRSPIEPFLASTGQARKGPEFESPSVFENQP